MSPSHAVKNRRRYRYYASSITSVVSAPAPEASVLRLPAADLERAVVDATAALVSNHHVMISLPKVSAWATRNRTEVSGTLRAALLSGMAVQVIDVLQSLDLRLVVRPDGIDASISQSRLVFLLDNEASPQEDIRLPIIVGTEPAVRGRNLKLVLRLDNTKKPNLNYDLIDLLRKAENARQRLFSYQTENHDRSAERLARLAFLSPDIVRAILEGRQPSSLTPRRLMKLAALPLGWGEQFTALAFA